MGPKVTKGQKVRVNGILTFGEEGISLYWLWLAWVEITLYSRT